MRFERGQASVEWIGLVLLVALGLGALGSVAPAVDGRSLGGFLAHRFVCAVKGGCHDGDAQLASAYGGRDAALLREHAPSLVYERGERALPVDPRRCRSRRCADALDDRDADIHRSRSGQRATVFTRVLRRRGRTYLQYWLYYPDSNTAWAGSDKAWGRSALAPLVGKLLRGSYGYPGFHLDDWEGVQVRIDADGKAWARATSHGHYQGCKHAFCRGRWIGKTGWSRVSRGSHAGHVPVEVKWPRKGPRVMGGPRGRGPLGQGPRARGPRARMPRHRPLLPGRDLRERTTTGEGLRLVPLETLDQDAYRRLDDDVKPPWDKDAYDDPESDES